MRRLLASILLVALAACGSDDDSADEATTSTTTSSTTTSTSSTTTGAVELGPPIALGEGTLVGVHPSAPIAYVSIIDRETSEVGCEGGDLARLWAQPLDGAAPRRALPDSHRSGIVLPGGDGGTVAVVEQCEGFLTSLSTARPATDGAFADLTEIDTTLAEESGQLQPSTIRWSADGRSLVGLVHALDGDDVRFVRIHLDGTVDELIRATGIIAAAELDGGRVVTATSTSVTIGDDAPVDVAVTSIAVRPDGGAVAVFGDDGVVVLEPDAARVVVDPGRATIGSFSSDGEVVAYLRLAGDEASVWVSRVGGPPAQVDDSGGFGAPLVSPDGAFVLYNDAVDGGQGFREPRATAREMGRPAAGR